MINDRIIFSAKIVILVSAILGSSGSTGPAKSTAMVPDRIDIDRQHPYSVSVRTQGGSQSSSTDAASISNEDFAKAIEASILKSGLFTEVIHGEGSNYNLNVTIVAMSKPLWGASLTVNMKTAWSLVNSETGDVVMKEAIRSSHTATMGDAFVGAVRLRFAVEGAARKNIEKGIQEISGLNLKR